MPILTTHPRGHFWRIALCLGTCIFLCQFLFAQEERKTVPTLDKSDRILVRGCLNHVLDQFHFASGDLDSWVVLTGNTVGLEEYVNRELLLEGSKGERIRIEGYFDPIPSFEVTKIVRVFEVAEPELAPDFTDKTAWRTATSKKYGVRFAHPESMTPSTEPAPTESSPATQEGVETVASFEIPSTAYPNANLRGGSFTIVVNRAEKTQKSCTQFAEASSGDEAPSYYSVGNIRYFKTTNSDVGMGSWQLWNNFHIFRNGLCYQISIELFEYNAQNADTGCNVPLLSPEDNWDLIKSLIDRVSFFHPNSQQSESKAQTNKQAAKTIVYENKKYRFRFMLPESWKGYSIIVGQWRGSVWDPAKPEKPIREETGPFITIRHPLWTESNPRQDIPIMILTHAQGELANQGNLSTSAAPYGPQEIARNAKYVFALPPRYTGVTEPGIEEVVGLIREDSLRPF